MSSPMALKSLICADRRDPREPFGRGRLGEEGSLAPQSIEILVVGSWVGDKMGRLEGSRGPEIEMLEGVRLVLGARMGIVEALR